MGLWEELFLLSFPESQAKCGGSYVSLSVHTTPWTPSEALGTRPESRPKHSAWGEESRSCDLSAAQWGWGRNALLH